MAYKTNDIYAIYMVFKCTKKRIELSLVIILKKKKAPPPLSCCDLFVVRIKKDTFPFNASAFFFTWEEGGGS